MPDDLKELFRDATTMLHTMAAVVFPGYKDQRHKIEWRRNEDYAAMFQTDMYRHPTDLQPWAHVHVDIVTGVIEACGMDADRVVFRCTSNDRIVRRQLPPLRNLFTIVADGLLRDAA